MKKILLSITLVLIAVAFISNVNVVNASPTKIFNAKASILINENGEVLQEEKSNDRYPIASMVKIMSLLNIYEAIDSGRISLDDDVTVSKYATSMGGSQAFLETNGKYKVKNLIRSVVVASANDSCVALAEHTYGSVDSFVSNMNEKVAKLNLKNTRYVNCTGLPADNQYSSAYDSAIIFANLIKHNQYFADTKVWTDDFLHPSGRTTLLTNTNKLVRFYNGCDGGKTGFTNEALHCLTATAIKGDTRVISCVIGAEDSNSRFEKTKTMFDYAFANYECKVVAKKTEKLNDVKVSQAINDTYPIALRNDLKVWGKRGEISGAVVYEINSKLKAPISLGETVGYAMYVKDGRVLAKEEIISTLDITEASYWDMIKKIAMNW